MIPSLRLASLSLAALPFAVAPLGGTVDGPREGPRDAPPLVVLVVVDQLRADLLDRYDEAFTGGLRRLRDGGFRFLNATHDHAITETAPGHATLSTGTNPARHGVVSNEWYEARNGQPELVLNVVDPDHPLLDDPARAGASPAALLRNGLADWMQAAHGEARVVSVSGKDRAAVLMAARSDAQVYWFSSELGRFVTSTHYREAYPDWVDRFNREVIPPMAGDSTWQLGVPEMLRSLARRDSAGFEGDGIHTAFPHAYRPAPEGTIPRSFWSWWATTPTLDRATLLLAREAVEEEGLGGDPSPDLLAISLSQTDRVGHAYGPRSLEQLDNLVRLDRELGDFMDWLDGELGPDGYIMAFTADHGVLDIPEFRVEEGRFGLRLNTDSVAAVQRVIDRVAGGADDPQELARRLAERLPQVSWIHQAWSHQELTAPPAAPDSFTALQLANHAPGRLAGLLSRAGVEMQLEEGVLTWSFPRGTTHGSPWYYDRHVPLVFYGAGIGAGASEEAVSATDVAPTLAALLGIDTPDDLDGVARTLIPPE